MGTCSLSGVDSGLRAAAGRSDASGGSRPRLADAGGVCGAGRTPGVRRRVLFVAEAVTLAHVGRPLALAQALEPAKYEIHFACDPRYDRLLGELPFERSAIRSIPSRQFFEALARGAPVYDAETLRGYVRADLELIEASRPEVVVGDFRLSLAVSAELSGVPYLAIANAYWSPYARQRWPVPEHAVAKLLGAGVGGALFRMARPAVFAYHSVPLNRVRAEYGLPRLGLDLRRIYTHGDHTLYADARELVPTEGLPETHHYLGPILWSPAVELPSWWDEVPRDRPTVYVTLGSSGREGLCERVLEALAGLPVTVLAATAGYELRGPAPGQSFVADYLPGQAAAARAELVICNGGSATAQQALAAGAPVLGIASNLDQHLSMGAVERAGAGELVRAERADVERIRVAARRLLDEASYHTAAAGVAKVFARYDAGARFRQVVGEICAVISARAVAAESHLLAATSPAR